MGKLTKSKLRLQTTFKMAIRNLPLEHNTVYRQSFVVDCMILLSIYHPFCEEVHLSSSPFEHVISLPIRM
jgi:hypothetical protein